MNENSIDIYTKEDLTRIIMEQQKEIAYLYSVINRYRDLCDRLVANSNSACEKLAEMMGDFK